MSVCARMISSWVRKVSSIAKAHMPLYTVHSAVASAYVAANVYLVPFLEAGYWTNVSMPAIHYFSMHFATTDGHQDSRQHAILHLSE